MGIFGAVLNFSQAQSQSNDWLYFFAKHFFATIGLGLQLGEKTLSYAALFLFN
ncbi:hypothetical protein VCHE48_0955 [Vibrio cholerae HE48]|nr:hypothetical protein VCHE48_0955 [Vibrio cholerae HE48]EJH52833.1 hypothetical protein VCHC43B1_2209 [Vibrio cholerae HC-43B1]EMP91892.1 hypothetical protein VC116063_003169 [Vibrio cholerae O1 str. 116063]QAV06966.1 hypothetical protein FORC76_3469 [Vibrio cholerae]CPR29691.1 hypothetical protein [Vibrio cholerae]